MVYAVPKSKTVTSLECTVVNLNNVSCILVRVHYFQLRSDEACYELIKQLEVLEFKVTACNVPNGNDVHAIANSTWDSLMHYKIYNIKIINLENVPYVSLLSYRACTKMFMNYAYVNQFQYYTNRDNTST